MDALGLQPVVPEASGSPVAGGWGPWEPFLYLTTVIGLRLWDRPCVGIGE